MTIGVEESSSTKSICFPAWDSVIFVRTVQLASEVWSDNIVLDVDDMFVGQSTLPHVVSGVRLNTVDIVK